MEVRRLLVGHFMTALDMAGLSLSLLDLSAVDEARLDAATRVPPPSPPPPPRGIIYPKTFSSDSCCKLHPWACVPP